MKKSVLSIRIILSLVADKILKPRLILMYKQSLGILGIVYLFGK